MMTENRIFNDGACVGKQLDSWQVWNPTRSRYVTITTADIKGPNFDAVPDPKLPGYEYQAMMRRHLATTSEMIEKAKARVAHLESELALQHSDLRHNIRQHGERRILPEHLKVGA